MDVLLEARGAVVKTSWLLPAFLPTLFGAELVHVFVTEAHLQSQSVKA